MEAAAGAAAARAGLLVTARAYGGTRGPRPRVVGGGAGAGLAAAPGGGRRGALVASLREPLEAAISSPAQDGSVAAAPRADDAEEEAAAAHGDSSAAENSSPAGGGEFVLKKQCAFGQSFHLVGDHPALGVWDPLKAVALEWSDGHAWIVEKDLPANEEIEFKFLLRDTSGKFHWQNGPNRSLRTTGTANTLVVYEDWGDVKNRQIAEGDTLFGPEEQVVSNDDESTQSVILDDVLQVDDQDIQENESTLSEDEEMSATNASVVTNASVQGESVKEIEDNPPESMLHEELKIQDELQEKVMENSSASCAEESEAEKTEEDNILVEDGVPVENGLTSAFEHDLLWGWKALRQLLMSLGFKMDAT
ncbi:hypothetical protein ACP4OV_028607 [Aristida adscensionis]